jgi:hypothetical protein
LIEFSIQEESIIREEEEELPLPMDTKTEEETNVISSSESEEQPVNTENEVNVSPKVENETDVPSNVETENEVDVPPKVETENAHPVLDQSVIIEGKRSRKPTLRLEISESVPTKKELSIPQGHGKPLGEIEYSKSRVLIEYPLQNISDT